MAPKRSASPNELHADINGNKRQKISPKDIGSEAFQPNLNDTVTVSADSPKSNAPSKKPPKKKADSKEFNQTHIASQTNIVQPIRTTRAATRQFEDLQRELETLRKRIKDLEADRDQANARMRRMLDLKVAESQEVRLYQQEDETVKEKFRDLSTMISDWSASWARKNAIAEGEAGAHLPITPDVLFDRHRILHDSIREGAHDAALRQPGGSRAAVQTILEHIIVDKLLTRPFHFLALGFGGIRGPTEASLKRIYNIMGDRPERNLWRARTLRLLYMPHQSQGSMVEDLAGDFFSTERKVLRDDLVKRCLSGAKSILLPLLTQCNDRARLDRRNGLSTIFEAAGKLSLQIWIQGAHVSASCLDLDCLSSGFATGHTHYELHPMMDPDIDSKFLTNMPVDWMIRPCITLQHYNADGKPSSRVVVSKAQVAVFETATQEPNILQEPEMIEAIPVNIEAPQTQVHKAQELVADGTVVESENDQLLARAESTPSTGMVFKQTKLIAADIVPSDEMDVELKENPVRSGTPSEDMQSSHLLQGTKVDTKATGASLPGPNQRCAAHEEHAVRQPDTPDIVCLSSSDENDDGHKRTSTPTKTTDRRDATHRSNFGLIHTDSALSKPDFRMLDLAKYQRPSARAKSEAKEETARESIQEKAQEKEQEEATDIGRGEDTYCRSNPPRPSDRSGSRHQESEVACAKTQKSEQRPTSPAGIAIAEPKQPSDHGLMSKLERTSLKTREFRNQMRTLQFEDPIMWSYVKPLVNSSPQAPIEVSESETESEPDDSFQTAEEELAQATAHGAKLRDDLRENEEVQLDQMYGGSFCKPERRDEPEIQDPRLEQIYQALKAEPQNPAANTTPQIPDSEPPEVQQDTLQPNSSQSVNEVKSGEEPRDELEASDTIEFVPTT